jgi:diaminopimelate decarboxylase
MKTPYFKFNREILKKNYREFEALCETNLKDFKIAYSVKTNSDPLVIETLEELGANFEVASMKEINLVAGKYRVFNGPCKTKEELKVAIKNKFLINVDSVSEVEKISEILNGKEFNIGIRASLKESKFGVGIEELKPVIQYANSKNLNIISIHFHQGTQSTLTSYKESMQKFSKLIKENAKILPNLKFIDVGGGFPDKIQLKNLNVKLDDYLITIKENLSQFNMPIILEPGRNLVSNAFKLITRVNGIKEQKDKKYAIIDAGINILPKITMAAYQFKKIKPELKNKELPATESKKQEYILAGPLLFASDTLGKISENLSEGDLIEVENVGAYCYNLAWTISYDKPGITEDL